MFRERPGRGSRARFIASESRLSGFSWRSSTQERAARRGSLSRAFSRPCSASFTSRCSERLRVAAILGLLLGALVRLWVATLRVRVVLSERLPAGPKVVAFLHGQQMALLAARGVLGESRAVLVSRSRDGDVQSAVMRTLGFTVVRGSSSRAGAAGLTGLVRALRGGGDVCVAVDGPRGPLGVVKPGAVHAGRLGAADLVLAASAASHGWYLDRTWDRFRIPAPFARVAITVEVIGPVDEAVDPGTLSRRLRELHTAAQALLASRRRSWQSRVEAGSWPRSS
jgi:lysophospholipid acyltransferase (LPLAT)-like uncharacterized protein